MAFCKILPRAPRSRQYYSLSFVRRFSFSTPEEAATERRRRRRLLGMPPPSHLGDIPFPQLPGQPPVRKPQASPSIPKLPEPASSISGPRLQLHNNILTLLQSGDLQEASLLVRHSVYSNCRPTIYTVNAVLSALLGKSLHSDLVSLHRFVNQAGIAPTIVTHNLVIQCYINGGKLDVALTYYRFLCRDLPLLPSPSTYRILVKALLSASRIEEALQLKDEMNTMIEPDLEVYSLLMTSLVETRDPDRALVLNEELTEKLGNNGRTVYGSLMKAYFEKGMEKEALELYNSVLEEENFQFRFSAKNYNSVLDSLCKNAKSEEASTLFEKMMGNHCPPIRLCVDLESFTLMVNGYCASGRFKEAIEVFRKTGSKKISADTEYYNNLINQLGRKGMVLEAEEIFREMSTNGIQPNENTFVFLMEACFVAERTEDGAQYLSLMADSGVEPGTPAYNTALCGLVKAEKLDEAKFLFDQMTGKKVKRDIVTYEVLVTAFCESNSFDHVLVVVRALLMEDEVVFRPHVKELVEAAARKEEMEEELARLYVEVGKEKEDELVRISEKKTRSDALAREERLGKRAEAKAKQAATTRITKEHIEMHIKRYALSNAEQRNDVPINGGFPKLVSDNGGSFAGIFLNGQSKQVSCITPVEALKVGDEDGGKVGGEEIKGVKMD